MACGLGTIGQLAKAKASPAAGASLSGVVPTVRAGNDWPIHLSRGFGGCTCVVRVSPFVLHLVPPFRFSWVPPQQQGNSSKACGLAAIGRFTKAEALAAAAAKLFG